MTFSKEVRVLGAIRTTFHAFPDGRGSRTQPSLVCYASGVRKEIPISRRFYTASHVAIVLIIATSAGLIYVTVGF